MQPDLIQQAVDAVREHGTVAEAARRLGIPRKTLADRYAARDVSLDIPKAAPPPPPEPDPVALRTEARDAAFWRSRANALSRDLADAEALVRNLGGIRDVDTTPPAWTLPGPGRVGRAVVGCLLSDLHLGEVIEAREILGVNAYNVEVAAARLRRFFTGVITAGERWGADCSIEGAYVALGGDLISGDIHEELLRTNELTSHDQVRAAVREIVAGLLLIADAFGHVHVACVPGNHGRSTMKQTAKLAAALSYDTMIGSMVADRLGDDGRFTFQISPGIDARTPILGHDILLTHGNAIGTGGGHGFAGPNLPIVRGAKKIMAQHASISSEPDLILMGHFHTSSNPGGVLANGSVPGYSEYGNGLRVSLEPPKQWAFLIHERWGLRERCDLILDDILPPEVAPTHARMQ